MSEQPHEDPVAHASTKITAYVSVAAMAAEAIAQVAAARARERAAADERTASALRAQRLAAYGQARLGWAPVLDPKLREQTTLTDAAAVWARAQAWRPDPEAERASDLAEERLRQLRPDAMEHYDRLRQHGVEPVEAMRQAAPFFDRPPARPGEPGPDRATLTEADTARRAATAETGRDRQQMAVADDPATAAVDEHADAAGQAAPHQARAAGEDATARSLAATTPVEKTPVDLAGEDFPQPVTAAPRPPAQTSTAPAAPALQRTPARTATTAGRTR